MNTNDHIRDGLRHANGSGAGGTGFSPVAALARHWKLVLATPAAAVALTAVALALVPPPYTASTTVVLSSYQGGQGGAGSAALGQLPAGLGGLIGTASNPQSQMLASVMKSRALRQRVAAMEGDSTPDGELARALGPGASIDRRPDDGSVVVSVTSRDPELAARVANHFPSAINDVMGRMAAEAAQRKQVFLERQVQAAREQLAESEEQVLRFQQTRNVGEPQEQANRTLEAAAALQDRINRQEMEVARIRRTATPNNPQLRVAEAQLGQLRGQLSALTTARGSNPVYVPLKEGPELRVATTRLQRRFKEHEQVYAALTTALAQARIDANNNLPVVTVMDPATVPASPSRSRGKLLILATILGLVGGAVLALALGWLGHAHRAPAPP
ncbi:MAG: hypothetical protein ICV87_07760, partial [Gemmatimonadetes bacterium]|nr:hypothetical protein [Gemmatimonadota bacterium]